MQILSKHSKCKHVTQYVRRGGEQVMFMSLPQTRVHARGGIIYTCSIQGFNREARFLYTFNYLIKYIYIQNTTHIHSRTEQKTY